MTEETNKKNEDPNKKKDKKAPETFLEPELLIKAIKSPQDLDLFMLETKSRKIIQELMQPILNDMDSDRRQVVQLKVH
jgi:hypothetical protein